MALLPAAGVRRRGSERRVQRGGEERQRRAAAAGRGAPVFERPMEERHVCSSTTLKLRTCAAMGGRPAIASRGARSREMRPPPRCATTHEGAARPLSRAPCASHGRAGEASARMARVRSGRCVALGLSAEPKPWRMLRIQRLALQAAALAAIWATALLRAPLSPRAHALLLWVRRRRHRRRPAAAASPLGTPTHLSFLPRSRRSSRSSPLASTSSSGSRSAWPPSAPSPRRRRRSGATSRARAAGSRSSA